MENDASLEQNSCDWVFVFGMGLGTEIKIL